MFSELLTNYFLICFFCYENLDKFYYVCYTYTIKFCCDTHKVNTTTQRGDEMADQALELDSVKSKILHAAAKLFLSIGYEQATILKIADEAKVNRGSVIYFFKNKENIVCELVSFVLEGQFKATTEFLKGKTEDKILFYAAETTLQLYIAESSEHMREMYNVAYSLRDMKESTKDGAFVQVGAYWYEVQDLTKSIEAIKEAIEEAENEVG